MVGANRNDSPMPSGAGIFTVHRGEFQPHSTSGPYVLHNSLRPNRAFLDKKLKLDRCTQGVRHTCLEKQISDTQISYG